MIWYLKILIINSNLVIQWDVQAGTQSARRKNKYFSSKYTAYFISRAWSRFHSNFTVLHTNTHTLSVNIRTLPGTHTMRHRDYVPFFQSVSSRSATTQTATGEHKHGEAPPHTSRSLTRSLINSPTCARSFSSEVYIAFLTGENCRAIKSSEEEHSSSWY